MNNVSLIGNIGQDFELRYFESGSVKVDISIGISRFMGKDKEPQTDWITCQAWGKTAEIISEHFSKGSKIGITGNLKQERWEKDGEKKSRLIVLIESVHFCEKKSNSGDAVSQARDKYVAQQSGGGGSW